MLRNEVTETNPLDIRSAAPGAVVGQISNGQSITGVIDLGVQRAHRLELPAAWTPAPISFQAAGESLNFQDLYNEVGEYCLVAGVTGVGARVVALDQSIFYGIRFLKIRSGLSATPVSQAADRTLTIYTVAR